jgi:hypothetical protein
METVTHRTPDEECRRRNEEAGHTLCDHCNGTGNELYSMYRTCPECGGNGIEVEYGELSSLGRWWAERRERLERKRLARKYRAPRDWKVEIAWRLSRWFGIGQCFHGSEDQCHLCGAPAGDIDYEVRRVGPFRVECSDREMCAESAREMEEASA